MKYKLTYYARQKGAQGSSYLHTMEVELSDPNDFMEVRNVVDGQGQEFCIPQKDGRFNVPKTWDRPWLASPLRLTEEEAYQHIDKVLAEEQGLYKGRPTGVDLPAYIEEARRECHARLTGQLQHEDTIDKDLWEDMVHDTVATLREEEQYNHDTPCPM